MSDVSTHDVTALLIEWRGGDAGAMERLLPLVHDELRRLARRHMAGERPGHVLQATALVHEAYLRLVDIRRVQWQDRAQQLKTYAPGAVARQTSPARVCLVARGSLG